MFRRLSSLDWLSYFTSYSFAAVLHAPYLQEKVHFLFVLVKNLLWLTWLTRHVLFLHYKCNIVLNIWLQYMIDCWGDGRVWFSKPDCCVCLNEKVCGHLLKWKWEVLLNNVCCLLIIYHSDLNPGFSRTYGLFRFRT